MHTARIYSLKEHRGAPRVYVEGKAPKKSGFMPGLPYVVEKHKNGIVVRLADSEVAKARTVSKKASKSTGEELPVLDLNNRDDFKEFKDCKVVRVVFGDGQLLITPVATEIRRVRRMRSLRNKYQNDEPLSTAGIAAGGAILTHAVHAGLEDSGKKAEVIIYNEIREDLTEHACIHNDVITDKTIVVNMPLQELAFDTAVLGQLKEEPNVAEIGLPCSGASISGMSKLGLNIAEEHPEVGHLVVGGLALLARLNPAAIIFENVPPYQKTASAVLLRRQLKDLGYDCHETLVYGPDFGDKEKRTRWCMVAMTQGIPFSFETMEKPQIVTGKLADVLEPPEAVAERWSKMEGLKRKQERDIEAKKGFMMQIYTGEESHINTLTKGISKNRSTDPKIQHPTDPELLRIPTAKEHARCKGIPEHLIEGLSQTTAHELLGQSITYKAFRCIAKHVGDALRNWAQSQDEISASAIDYRAAA